VDNTKPFVPKVDGKLNVVFVAVAGALSVSMPPLADVIVKLVLQPQVPNTLPLPVVPICNTVAPPKLMAADVPNKAKLDALLPDGIPTK
jgi:hypothetical protein